MEINFKDSDLEKLAYDDSFRGKWAIDIVNAFRKRIVIIQSAKNRTDLYNLKSNRLEKLKGKKQNLHSMRINDQYRIIISFDSEKGTKEETVTIHQMEDYHK